MADFKTAFTRTMGFEGGWSFLDGGTYKGIVRKTWPAWPGWLTVDNYTRKIGRGLHYNEVIKDVHLDAFVAQFYRSNFWNKINGDDITPDLIAGFVFDWEVNAWDAAITHLQRILNIADDGTFGSVTLQALNNSNYANVYLALKTSRIEYYKGVVKLKPEKKADLAGWLDRVAKFPAVYS